MLVASDEATAGYVIKKADLISPFIIGFNHFSFCSVDPYFAIVYILPVSGALQLKTSEAHVSLPIFSAKGAYSNLLYPGLRSP